MVNVELMQKVLDHITVHPEEWNQDTWATKSECGTAHCFAGHAVHMTGHNFAWEFGDISALVDGSLLVPDVAAQELGLELFQSLQLFYYGNSLADLYYLANAFTDGAITIPDELQGKVRDRVEEVTTVYANAAVVMDAMERGL